VLRKTLFVIMSTISLWFTLFVICINICTEIVMHAMHGAHGEGLHAVHGAQGEGWAPGHMHVGRRGKNVFGTHHLMKFSPLSFGNKQGGTFF